MIDNLLLYPDMLPEVLSTDTAAGQVVALAGSCGIRVWLACGAIQALHSKLRAVQVAAEHIRQFIASCQWLEALPADIDLDSDAPLPALHVHALGRLGPDARLLTRDPWLLSHCPAGLSPEAAIGQLVRVPGAFIDLAAQQDRLRPALMERIHRVLHHGHYIMGPEIGELEERLAVYVGVRHCISAASGTDTLEIALRALGIGPGDEVITVPFSWISSAEVIAAVGARPVFVDIDAASFCIAYERIEAAITPRTKAILPVSLFGQMPDYVRINVIAARHGLAVIEDGAQSFGATQGGRRSCGVTTIGSTSFFPAKPLGCYGDGGALFTNDDGLAARMRAIRSHGGEHRHYHPYIGMNGRLDTLQAAILLAKLDTWDAEVMARNRIGAKYSEQLRSVCAVPDVLSGNTHVYSQFTIRVPSRDRLAKTLKEVGIPSGIYYPKCLHEQPVFAHLGHRLGDYPEAERASREVLSLPMHPFLDETSQMRIVEAVRTALR